MVQKEETEKEELRRLRVELAKMKKQQQHEKKYGKLKIMDKTPKNEQQFKKQYNLTQKQVQAYKRDDGVRYFFNNENNELSKYAIKQTDLKKEKVIIKKTPIGDKEYAEEQLIIDGDDVRDEYKNRYLQTYINKSDDYEEYEATYKNIPLLKKFDIKKLPIQKMIKQSEFQIKNISISDNINNINDNESNVSFLVYINIKINPFYDEDITYKRMRRIFYGKMELYGMQIKRWVYDYLDYIEDMGISKEIMAFCVNTNDEYVEAIKNDDVTAELRIRDEWMIKRMEFGLTLEEAEREAVEHRPFVYEYYATSMTNNDVKFHYDRTNETMAKPTYYNLKNLISNIYQFTPSVNCVTDYLIKKYPFIRPKEILALLVTSNRLINGVKQEGVTPNILKRFCESYDIPLILYSFEGDIIIEYTPEDVKKNSPLFGIQYQGHFFPLNMPYIKRTKSGNYKMVEYKTLDEINNSFKSLITEQHTIPSDLKYAYDNKNKKIIITSYIDDRTLYINNDDYEICHKILSRFGLLNKMNPYVTLSKLYNIIEPLFNINNDDSTSFIPVDIQLIEGYNYVKPNIKDLEDVLKKTVAIDYTKFYSNMLRRLQHLIKCDYMTAIITPINDYMEASRLNPHYLYNVEPDEYNFYLETTTTCTGDYLMKCSEMGIKYKVIDMIQTTIINNFYSRMIDSLLNHVNDIPEIKSVINRMIGYFNKNMEVKKNSDIVKISSKQDVECETSAQLYTKYDDDIYLKFKISDNARYMTTNKIIRLQIMEQARLTLGAQLTKLKQYDINDDDIIRVHIDEITFYDKNNKLDEILKDSEDYETKNSGWRQTPLSDDINVYISKEIINCSMDTNNDNKNIPSPTLKSIVSAPSQLNFNTYNCNINKDNVLFLKYAGNGKSTLIKNNIIPSILNKNKSYIILTPTHNSLKTYKKEKMNCGVIQKYKYNNNVINEDYIIIDEFGMLNRGEHLFLLKNALIGKKIICLGDFKQLLPIGCNKPLNESHYLNFLFGKIDTQFTNYRNNHTKEYYDSILNGDYNYIMREMMQLYKCQFYESEIILCRTNKECDLYNRLMLRYLNLTFDMKNKRVSKGCKIICNTNKLNIFDIYNNYEFNVIESDDKTFTIYNDAYELKLDNNKLKYFSPSYAITFFKAQGQDYTTGKIYISPESLLKLSPIEAYLLISREKIDDINNELKISLLSPIEQKLINPINKGEEVINNELILSFD